jgi:hypothetical protein
MDLFAINSNFMNLFVCIAFFYIDELFYDTKRMGYMSKEMIKNVS